MSATIKKNNLAEKKGKDRFLFKFKWIKVMMLIGALMCSYLIVLGGVGLYSKYQQVIHPQSLVYGTWVESEVAPYVAERIVISSSGVSIDGGIVDTQFNFDGQTLSYQHGSLDRQFTFGQNNWDEMTLVTAKSYQPVFIKTR